MRGGVACLLVGPVAAAMRALPLVAGLVLLGPVAGVWRACPETVFVEITNDGIGYDLAFARNESLLGQGYAYALCHRLYFNGLAGIDDCDGMCAAQVLADDARRRFLESCAPAAVGGRFDVLQVGAHVGDTRNSVGELVDPVFKWLRRAPAHASALLVEPIRSSFEKLVANVAAADADVAYLHAAVVPDATAGDETFMFTAEPRYAATDIQGRVADLTQLASLDARHIEGHVDGTYLNLPEGVPPKLRRQRVATVDFASLRSLYGLARVSRRRPPTADAPGNRFPLVTRNVGPRSGVGRPVRWIVAIVRAESLRPVLETERGAAEEAERARPRSANACGTYAGASATSRSTSRRSTAGCS